MKTIPFEKALSLLESADDIIVADFPCTMRSSTVDSQKSDDPDHCFLKLEADDSDDYCFNWDFQEKDNTTVKIDGELMSLVCLPDDDNEASEIRVRLLTPMKLEEIC